MIVIVFAIDVLEWNIPRILSIFTASTLRFQVFELLKAPFNKDTPMEMLLDKKFSPFRSICRLCYRMIKVSQQSYRKNQVCNYVNKNKVPQQSYRKNQVCSNVSKHCLNSIIRAQC